MNKIVIISKACPEYLCDAIEKLNKFNNLKVNGLNAGELAKLEKDAPDLFGEIREKIIEGRWYPAAGLWNEPNGKISNECLARQILYSSDWLYKKFGIRFRAFSGGEICSSAFAQTVYNGRFDCAVLSNETESYWLEGEDRFRLYLMNISEKIDVKDIDETNVNGVNFETYEDMLHRHLSSPLDIKAIKAEKEDNIISDAEKAVINAEKATAQNGIDKTAEIRECWFDIFNGNDNEAIKKANKIADGKCSCDIVKINNEDVKVNVFKLSEDGSGDKIIRIEETAGTEKTISVMCDEINAGFRCEIEPYEIATYRIDADGFVKETFIFE